MKQLQSPMIWRPLWPPFGGPGTPEKPPWMRWPTPRAWRMPSCWRPWSQKVGRYSHNPLLDPAGWHRTAPDGAPQKAWPKARQPQEAEHPKARSSQKRGPRRGRGQAFRAVSGGTCQGCGGVPGRRPGRVECVHEKLDGCAHPTGWSLSFRSGFHPDKLHRESSILPGGDVCGHRYDRTGGEERCRSSRLRWATSPG